MPVSALVPQGPPPLARIPRWRCLQAGLLALALAGGVLAGAAGPASAAPGATTARDGFSRTTGSGWGAAEAGGRWTVSTAGRFAVRGGVGRVALTGDGQTRRATLPGEATATDVGLVLGVDRLPTGTGLYASVIGRRIPGVGTYGATVRWLSNGTVNVVLTAVDVRWAERRLTREVTVPRVRAGAGRPVRVRVQVTGTDPTTVRAKVWASSAAEPTAWTATATDRAPGWQAAGGVGIAGYLSRSSVPVTLLVDGVRATSTTPPSAPASPPTPAPAPVAPPVPVSPAPSQASGTRGSDAGALPVGTAGYPVPVGAVFVAPTGDDTAAGTVGAPWRTVARGIAAAPAGGTVVLRAGTYTESVTVPAGKRLTLQPYPGEAVWFDGSRPVGGWVADGAAWRADGWTPEFDSSPTYTAGAPDNTEPGWSFVGAEFPMAAHPDQVFVDGTPLRQVRSRAEVVAGTFFVDEAADRLYVGSDPAGHGVRASVLSTAITVRGAGSVVRGIGVQRYATSVPEKGTVRALAADVTLENLVVRDNATQGVFVGGRDLGVRSALRKVTAERNGMLGIESSYADGLVLDRVRSTGNNTEHFNAAPVAGGIKITRARGVTVTRSVVADNLGTGLWFDESVYDATVTGNDLLRNTGNGLAYEISARALVADNVIAGNGRTGLKLNNASDLTVWNNTVVDNAGRPVWVVQDSRVAGDLSTPGHDPRRSLPDPTVTWLLGPVALHDNVIGGRTTANCLLCVQDDALRRTAAQIAVTADGNLYARTGPGSPPYTATWPTGAADPQAFGTLAAFRSATGQEATGAEVTGSAVVDTGYRLTPVAVAQEAAVALPLPAPVASVAGGVAGGEHLGAWSA